MPSNNALPFTIQTRVVAPQTGLLTAYVGENAITSERLLFGSGPQREALVKKWADDKRLRNGARLKVADVREAIERAEQEAMAAVDAAAAAADVAIESDEAPSNKRDSQATAIVKMAIAQDATFWHDSDKNGFATLAMGGHVENWPIRSKAFRRWLAQLYYRENAKAPGSQGLQDAIGVLEGKAQFDGSQHALFVRVAEASGNIYLDLADADWNVVEISSNGWRLVQNPPVRFLRRRGMQSLPIPERGGSLTELREFVNVADGEPWILAIAWLIGAFQPRGPYPVLTLNGEQGSAKSTTARLFRALIDPNEAALRSEPRDERDLVIAASNGWIIGLDNLSRLPPWLSDALCRISTGGGFATRELYTDGDEVIFSGQRPIVLNGIEELATRSDLLDRAILLTLPAIPEVRRREEREFWKAFYEARPRILGALLDAVATALRRLDSVRLERLPRMADFARWVVAAEPALPWPAGAFMAAYTGNRAGANETAIDESAIGPILRSWAEEVTSWQGTASELLAALNARADDATRRQPGWPLKPNILSNALRRIAPNLRAVGIEVRFPPRGSRRRIIEIRTVAQNTVRDRHTVTDPGFQGPNANSDDGGVTMGDDGGDDPSSPETPFSGLKTQGDDDDDHLQPSSRSAPETGPPFEDAPSIDPEYAEACVREADERGYAEWTG